MAFVLVKAALEPANLASLDNRINLDIKPSCQHRHLQRMIDGWIDYSIDLCSITSTLETSNKADAHWGCTFRLKLNKFKFVMTDIIKILVNRSSRCLEL